MNPGFRNLTPNAVSVLGDDDLIAEVTSYLTLRQLSSFNTICKDWERRSRGKLFEHLTIGRNTFVPPGGGMFGLPSPPLDTFEAVINSERDLVSHVRSLVVAGRPTDVRRINYPYLTVARLAVELINKADHLIGITFQRVMFKSCDFSPTPTWSDLKVGRPCRFLTLAGCHWESANLAGLLRAFTNVEKLAISDVPLHNDPFTHHRISLPAWKRNWGSATVDRTVCSPSSLILDRSLHLVFGGFMDVFQLPSRSEYPYACVSLHRLIDLDVRNCASERAKIMEMISVSKGNLARLLVYLPGESY